jgi:hypothetical protein
VQALGLLAFPPAGSSPGCAPDVGHGLGAFACQCRWAAGAAGAASTANRCDGVQCCQTPNAFLSRCEAVLVSTPACLLWRFANAVQTLVRRRDSTGE